MGLILAAMLSIGDGGTTESAGADPHRRSGVQELLVV
jgi:hypothetical protein